VYAWRRDPENEIGTAIVLRRPAPCALMSHRNLVNRIDERERGERRVQDIDVSGVRRCCGTPWS